MAFQVLAYEDIRAAILRDIANLRPDAAVGADSDYAVRASATGAAIEGLYQHQAWIARQILPDTADADFLERWAGLYGITRRPAAPATGTVDFAGTNGAEIPIGTEAATVDGVAYVTTALGGIVAGVAAVAVQAALPGAAGNQAAGAVLTLSSAPAGVASTATIGAVSGGTDAESDAALLARLLARIRKPPHGGAAHDYTAWALEVAGVTAVWVYGLRRGLGTVDVVILAAGGLPSGGLVAATQAHIDPLRPVTADVLVLGPTAVPVAVTATLTLAAGADPAAVHADVTTALGEYFDGLAPGDTVYRNRIGALIEGVAGVVDYALAAPAANVATVVDGTHVELATLGTVSLT